jgi:hypothetical protein
MDSIETRVTVVETHIDTIREDVRGLKTDVGTLKTDVAVIKATMATKTDVDALRGFIVRAVVGSYALLGVLAAAVKFLHLGDTP